MDSPDAKGYGLRSEPGTIAPDPLLGVISFGFLPFAPWQGRKATCFNIPCLHQTLSRE
jgi:hypothetical protein